ncbi:hypothetical protein EX30DRAFT_162262 [Ascodesmis nigricans]|uniref:Transcription activator GCR1-like domain-containing protein n=1 Tax=Ascodesmis nigricans TaxID=341454 RepID=A0A4S2MRA1_9PEZI|nr:hypothetical protein EX30DRAFT_162262 [Ascodesmis nigricans]
MSSNLPGPYPTHGTQHGPPPSMYMGNNTLERPQKRQRTTQLPTASNTSSMASQHTGYLSAARESNPSPPTQHQAKYSASSYGRAGLPTTADSLHQHQQHHQAQQHVQQQHSTQQHQQRHVQQQQQQQQQTQDHTSSGSQSHGHQQNHVQHPSGGHPQQQAYSQQVVMDRSQVQGRATPVGGAGRAKRLPVSHAAPVPVPQPAPVAPPPAHDAPVEETCVRSLRVREDGGTETFAMPLDLVNSWETLTAALQSTFQKDTQPKLMNNRGDTIAPFLLTHYLKDGTLLIVSFPPSNNSNTTSTSSVANTKLAATSTTTTASIPPPPPPQHPPTPQPAVRSKPQPPPTPASTSQTENPPTPYSPPIHTSSITHTNHAQHSSTSTPAPLTPNPPPSTLSVSASTTSKNSTVNTNSTNSNAVGENTYKLSRAISTVQELWTEWEHGLKGSPSVKSLEAKYGPAWRKSQAERKFYSRRKVIIDEVKKLIDQGYPYHQAVEKVESYRDGRSLDALSKGIVEVRKKGGTLENLAQLGLGKRGHGGGGGGGGGSASGGGVAHGNHQTQNGTHNTGMGHTHHALTWGDGVS